MKFIVYDTSGRIIRALGGPALEAGQALLDVSSDGRPLADLTGDRLMVVEGGLAERPTLPGFDRLEVRGDGEDAATLSGLPAGTVVYVEGAAYAPTDGTFAVVATLPGAYRVTVDAWPYQLYQATITATEAV